MVEGDEPSSAARPRVLVVDDVETVRAVAQRVLDRIGYDSDMAVDGLTAIEMLRAGTTSYDAVLLDLSMPGISGEETLCKLRALAPLLPVVFMTGFSESMTRAGFLGDDPYLGFVHKPFRPQDLEVELSRVRAAARAAAATSDDD